MKRIDQIHVVDDLQNGEIALPASQYKYDLRKVNGKPMGLNVKYVVRIGEELFAWAGGQSYQISDIGHYVLCPKLAPTPTNFERADLVEELLDNFYDNRDEKEQVQDVLSDLRHFCDSKGLSFGSLDRQAYEIYVQEKTHAL